VENGQNGGYSLTFESSFSHRLDAPDLDCKAGHNKFKLRHFRNFPGSWRLSFSFFTYFEFSYGTGWSTEIDKFEFFNGFFAHFFPQRLRVQAGIRSSHLVPNFIVCSSQFWTPAHKGKKYEKNGKKQKICHFFI
jgi:hypothetical protein